MSFKETRSALTLRVCSRCPISTAAWSSRQQSAIRSAGPGRIGNIVAFNDGIGVYVAGQNPTLIRAGRDHPELDLR